MTQHLSCLVVSCPIVACCLDGSILNTGASRGQEDDDDNTDLLELHFSPNTVHTEGFLRQESTPGLDQGTPFGPQQFSCKFSRKSGFVRCPCACPLRKLAQTLRCGVVPILGRGIFLVNSRINCSCEMPTRISTARTKRAAKFGAHHFRVHSRIKVAL